MPLYSFKCPKCNKEVDKQLPLAEYDTPQYCDCAKAVELVRQISRTGINFVGKWYSTSREY